MSSVATRMLILIVTTISLGGCLKIGFLQKDKQPVTADATAKELTLKEAQFRKSLVSDISYELYLDLSDTHSLQFSGRTSIVFTLKKADKPLRLDFQAGDIQRVLVNSTPSSPTYNGHSIAFPAGTLKTGQNIIEIEYRQKYSTNGSGLNRFRDPADQRLYLFTDLEPFAASKVFPAFDQPDLKASYKLTVRAPEEWQVVSSNREKQTIREGSNRWWYFPASQKFSPYLFSVHAGPYRVWENNQYKVPMRLMARQSISHTVRPKEWFSLTAQGMSYFEEYFDIAYPWLKYDQILVPEHPFTGMENRAAVTFKEDLANRKITSKKPLMKATYIFHELVHRWFGNLVTMNGWDDVWLNEGFANYMAFKAMAEGTSLTDVWPTFYRKLEADAYFLDRLDHTRPLYSSVTHTGQEEEMFDPLVYAKGPAVLKQLEQFVTPAVFRQGVRDYLQQHQESNAGPDELRAAMEAAAGYSLKSWFHSWFYTPGVNSVTSEFQM